MISYYELLGMIKDGIIPEFIELNLKCCDEPCVYKADYDGREFNSYILRDTNRESCNYRYFLNECFLDSDVFEQNIKIIDDKKIELTPCKYKDCGNEKYFEYLADKLNIIIDYLKEKENEE